jgi:hypothetical protein
VRTREHGAGSGEILLLMAFFVYVLFMGYLGNSLDYTTPMIGAISGWHLPYVNTGVGFFTAVIDVLVAIINVFAWVIGALVSYAALIGFSIGGDLPVWITGFLFGPLAFGMGWLIISLVRGRE